MMAAEFIQRVGEISVAIIVALFALEQVIGIGESTVGRFIPRLQEGKHRRDQEKLRKAFEAHQELFLEQLGLKDRKQLAIMRQSLEFVRSLGKLNMKDQLREFVFRYAMDQEADQYRDQVNKYHPVRYYIDFEEAAADHLIGRELAEIAQSFISEELSNLKGNPDAAIEYDKIVVPVGGNIFLGLRCAELLGKPVVLLHHQAGGRRFRDDPWSGNLAAGDRVILLNDIGVTGKGIEHAVKTIRKVGAEVKHAFLLVERTPARVSPILKDLFVDPVYLHVMLEMSDEEIEQARQPRSKTLVASGA